MISQHTAARIEVAHALLAIRRKLLDERDSGLFDQRDLDDIAQAANLIDGVVNRAMGVPNNADL